MHDGTHVPTHTWTQNKLMNSVLCFLKIGNVTFTLNLPGLFINKHFPFLSAESPVRCPGTTGTQSPSGVLYDLWKLCGFHASQVLEAQGLCSPSPPKDILTFKHNVHHPLWFPLVMSVVLVLVQNGKTVDNETSCLIVQSRRAYCIFKV